MTALDRAGELRWTWDAPDRLTRVDAAGGRVVVGDADGRSTSCETADSCSRPPV